jgi:hypothetical protein
METPCNKPRSDAWDADLDEAQRWQAYAQFRRSSWFDVSAWVANQFGIPAPSRSALYRWASRMREQESAHRLEQAIIARDEVGVMAASAGQSDSALIECYKTMAADLALRQGDAKTAYTYTAMAMDLAAAQTKKVEVELKARAQTTKDEALRLAREKFEAAEARIAATRKTIERLNQTGGLTPEARAEIEKAMGML